MSNSDGLIKREDLHESLLQELDKVNTVAPAVGFGMNNVIKNTGRASASPKFTIKGKTLVNLLGKSGNCEDTSKFETGGGYTIALDSTAKVFGASSIKITSTDANLEHRESPPYVPVDPSKYYCVSAYVKLNTIPSARIRLADGMGSLGSLVSSDSLTSLGTFSRIFTKINPATLQGVNLLRVDILGTATAIGQTLNFDGIMLEEITASQYADSNFTPSPYVDGYACLTNPYVEIRHSNLFRNGACEEGVSWLTKNGSGSLSANPTTGVFTTTTGATETWNTEIIPVKPNTDYYLYYTDKVSSKISIANYNNTANVLSDANVGTFNSGNNNQLYVAFSALPNTTGTIGHIMIVEGTAPPKEYKTCEVERVVLEGKFADGDYVTYDGGVDGLVVWEHRALLGTEYGWQFNNDGTLAGCKKITLQMDKLVVPNTNLASSYSNVVETKPDGSINPTMNWGALEASTSGCYINESGVHYILVPDAESGWAESVSPNTDEARAFMSGWKAVSTDGTRYRAWVSQLDETVPLTGCVYSMNTTGNSAGTQITCDDSKYAVGDIVAFKMADGTWKSGTISSKGTGCIYVNAFTGTALAGYPVIKCDSSLSVVGRSNLAPNYTGYQIHFKSLSPKPVTDSICRIHGDTPTIKEGDNYILVDSGRVIGETASIQINGDAFINGTGKPLANKVSKLITVYKNNVDDTTNWIRGTLNGNNFKI